MVLEDFDELLTFVRCPGSICLYRDVPWPGRIERSSLNMDLHHVSYCVTMWAIVFNMFSNTEVISSIDRQCLTYVGRWATS